MRSLFRPERRPDPGMLDQHRPLLRRLQRRGLLRGGVSLGALAMLSGCKLDDNDAVNAALMRVSRFNDAVQAWLFDPNKLAPTYRFDQVLRPPRFNAYYNIEDVKPVDVSAWKLELAGLVSDKTPWTASGLAALPEQEVIIRHVCVEGWDYIGAWSGIPMRAFLERVGADLTAQYVGFRCADDYTSSIDMATALHPQTILATKYARETMADPFGCPLRLRTATKLGFKNPKWITAIEVTNENPGGYWENAGFNWYSGL